ncbi:MAG TPA: preprotein translocase subunit SecE [Mizugakiibacter sp.]|nr:preprotein translocase subunit SecE [Mizugakiibacter sp.]
MSTKAERNSGGKSTFDTGKLVLAALVLLAGIGGYYYFMQVAQSLRIMGVLAAILIAAGIAAFTEFGRMVRSYVHESQFEMRKVVWPGRDTVLRTTIVVAIAVVIIAALLGLIDFILKKIILDWLLKVS